VLSKTAIGLFYTCPKAYEYTYIRGFESMRKSREMEMGLLGHAMLEGEVTKLPIKHDHELEPIDIVKIRLLVTHKPYTLPEGLKVEVEFSLPELGEKGVFDGVDLSEDGIVRIWEHKFTKSDFASDETYWQRLRTDWQVGMYLLAAQYLYPDRTPELLLNAHRVPQLRQRKNETDSEFLKRVEEDILANQSRYYGQGTVRWNADSLARLEADLKETQALIATGVYPRSRKCLEYRRQCDYHPVCFEGADLVDGPLYQVRKKR
jgi:hypothetical protein